MADLFCNQITLNASTMREAIEGLSTNFYGFRSYFLNKIINGVNYCFVDVNGNEIESFCIDMPLTENEYDILPSVRGSSGNFGIGATLFGSNLLLGFGMQFLSDALGPEEDEVPEYEVISTNSHIYSKNENRAGQGTPIPVIYGQLRVGSQIISSSIHNYDYDYTSTEIYKGKPFTTQLSKLVNGSEYSFINAADINDLRTGAESENVTAEDTIEHYKDKNEDPSKRFSLTENIYGQDGSAEKVFKLELENEAINETFENNTESSNERKHFGPSEGSPTYTKADASWWDRESKSPRPFVYPIEGNVDINMRPSSSNEYCVSRESKAGQTMNSVDDKCLSFVDDFNNNSIRPMTVGNRGSYQKLESIGIYKSLEILSEGPIAGLANPITGNNRDNGFVNYPYEKSDFTFSSNRVLIESLKFSNDSLVSLKNGNEHLVVKNGGKNYIDGNYNLIGDGTPGLNGLSIKVSPPKQMSSASIMSTNFQAGDSNEDGLADNAKEFNNDIYYTSSNNLFVLKESTGEITINSNSSLTDSLLPNAYIDGDSVNLKLLSEHANDLPWSSTRFRMGKGYKSSNQTFTIHPDNKNFKVSPTIALSEPRDRVSQAKCLDMGAFFADNLFDSNISEQIHEFYSNTGPTIPFTSQSWNKMPRCFLDADAGDIDFNSSITFQIGAVFWGGQNIQNIQITITMKQYISLESVSVSNPNSRGVRFGNSANWHIWNEDFTSEVNLFDELIKGSPQPLGSLLRNKNFADFVFDQFNQLAGNNLKHIVLPSFLVKKTNSLEYGGGKYINFTIGSGSSHASGKKFSNWNFPHHILDIQNNKDFDDIAFLDRGVIPTDDSVNPKGYYSSLIFPRVTVFVLRKTSSLGRDTVSLLPTNIDAVAQVNNQGLVQAIHLLRAPDHCVYQQGSGWSPIQPHAVEVIKPFILNENSFAVRHQDIGFYCKIDPSNSETECKFIIDNGSLTFDPINGSFRHLSIIEEEWSNHISNNNGSFVGSGLFITPTFFEAFYNKNFNISRNFNIEPTSSLNNPSVKAQAKVEIETIDLSSGNFKKQSIKNFARNTDFQFLSTGRPVKVSLTNVGQGYTSKNGNSNGSKISLSIFNQTPIIKNLEITDSGKGYKPNMEFYAFGQSKSKQNNSINSSIFLNSCKFKIKTNNTGSIDSIKVIDGGFGFMMSDNDFMFSHEDVFYPSLKIPLQIDSTEFVEADQLLPKSPLVIEVDKAALEVPGFQGSITKFKIASTGLGFSKMQIIQNPFESINFIPPEFNIQIVNGSVSLISLKRPSVEQGYSELDDNVSVQLSPPQLALTSSQVNDAQNDPHAWARSIYLNDVPIRDKDGRFNFTKFHFDMRIGHGKNGRGLSNLPINQVEEIASKARPSMISDEFKLPSTTKITSFPLYGPRNENEKDYYYSYTVKNPEVSTVSLSIQINKLHYTYEGDESALYVNLIPLMMAGIGFMLGKAAKDGIAAALAVPDKTISTQAAITGTVFGAATPCVGTINGTAQSVTNSLTGMGGFSSFGEVMLKSGEIAKQATTAALAASVAAGAVGMVVSFILVNAFPCSKISWLCFKIGEIIKNSGEIWPAKMRLAIEYGVEGGEMKKDIIAFSGCATSPYVKDIVIDNFPAAEGSDNNFKNRIIKVYRTTRELDPLANGIVEARYQIDAELNSITEYIEGFFGYPNTAIIGTRINSKDHPDIPKKEYLIKGRMIRVPSNYNPSNGEYTGIWDGKFKQTNHEDFLEWTSNPAWIIYDLLTHPTYGMGKYNIKDSDIDVWSFYRFAQFCDEKVDVVIEGIQTQERRHMCNLYVDTEKQAYEYIKELLKIYNSSINFSGGKIYITCDFSEKNRNGSIMIFNNSNIMEGGFSYSSTPATSRITAVTVDYLDERDNYMQKSEYVEDHQSLKDHGYSHIRIPGIGITRRGEAHRLAWHKILSRQLEKEIINFKTGLRASYLRIGDIIEVMDRNKSTKHSGGKITKVINTNTVSIDIPTAALSNVNYLYIDTPVESIDSEGSRTSQFTKYEINSTNGFEVTFSENIDPSIIVGSSWIIESNDIDKVSPKKYRIKEIKEISNLEYEITALEYLESKYYYIDESTSSKNGIFIEERSSQAGNEIASFDIT
jgi:predicted phage tail protein